MNDLILGAIARVTSFVKEIRLKQVLTTLLAGFFVFASTACSASSQAATPGYSNNAKGSYSASSPYDKDNGPTRELYKPTQERVGGMNQFNDDLKYESGQTQKKAEKLINRVENNIDKNQAHNPKEVFQNAREKNVPGERVRDSANSIQESTERLANDLSEGTRKGTRNLQENAERAAENAPRIARDARRNAQGAAEDVGEGAFGLGEGLKNAASRAVNEIRD